MKSIFDAYGLMGDVFEILEYSFNFIAMNTNNKTSYLNANKITNITSMREFVN